MKRILFILGFIPCLCFGQLYVNPMMGGIGVGGTHLDPAYTGTSGILSGGYLTVHNTGGTFVSLANKPFTTGDSIMIAVYINSGSYEDVGVATHSVAINGTSLGYDINGWSYLSNPGAPDFSSMRAHNGLSITYGSLCVAGDTALILYNATTGCLYFGRNSTINGSPSSGVTCAGAAYTGLSLLTLYAAIGSFSGNPGNYTIDFQATAHRPAGWHGM